MALFGGIEAGGTKFVCAVGSSPDDLRDEIRFSTTSPSDTLGKTIAYFKEQNAEQPLDAIGVGSFGPVNLDKSSPGFGSITSSPKIEWQKVNIYREIKDALNLPVAFDTDVNAAALGEYRWGGARGLTDFIYLTIGTGIGGGGMTNGRLIHGLMHPEMGHIFIPHDREKDPFAGICPFHKNCFEGLASGPAIRARWGKKAEDLDEDHPAWDLEAHYIGLALVNYTLISSPQKIILGGGVMNRRSLLPKIHKKVKEVLNNYIDLRQITSNVKKYIALPKLGNQVGILGALALAETSDLRKK